MDQLLQYDEQLSIEVQQLAEAHHLGSLTTIYQRKIAGPIARIVGPVFVLLLLIGPIAIQWYYFGNQISHAFINTGGHTLISFAIFNLIWYVTIITISVAIYRHRNDRAYVLTDGLIAFTSNQRVVFRWDQIETVWRGTKDSEGGININTLRLHKTDGTWIKSSQLPGVQNISALCDTIEREFVRINLTAAIDNFRSGVPLSFGKLTISLSGVDKGKGEILPRSQVSHFDVAKTTVTIRKEGQKHLGWFRAYIPDVPNACLLRELVPYIRNSQSY